MNYTSPLQSLPEQKTDGILSNSLYEVSVNLILKPDKDSTRKLQTNISHQHKCRRLNNSKSNPTMYYKNYIPQPIWIYPSYAKLVQHF